MCVLALAWQAHPRWRLVLAGNRDELHARPAQPLGRWPDADHVIAGRDLLSGGTWLGVSEQGRLAVVTNLHGFGGPRADAPSRGLLLSDMLRGTGDFIDPTDAELDLFSAFNLIRVIGDEAVFWTNRPTVQRRGLSPGVYGLSNGELDEPWAKTVRLKTVVSDWLAGGDDPDVLLDGLHEEHVPGTQAVPTDLAATPMAPSLTPTFIRNPRYGTRCSTVVLIDAEGQGRIIERRFDASGAETGQTALDFTFPR